MSLAMAVIVITLVGVSGATILVFLAQAVKFEDDAPSLQKDILAVLPGVNCGACGYPSCQEYAVALTNGEKQDLCRPGRAKVKAEIEEILQRGQ